MKNTYILEYRTGWGESCKIEFTARTILDAREIAKNYCKHNFIKIAWLINENGKIYSV